MDHMYIDVQAIRDEGIDEDQMSDEKVEEYIKNWSAYVDVITGQFFEEESLEVIMEGNGLRTLFLTLPIIEVSELYINEEDDPLDSGLYIVFNSVVYPDDRRNPKIKLKESTFQSQYLQKIVGKFGFVDSEGNTPRLIAKVVKKMALKSIYAKIASEGSASGSEETTSTGIILREKTDGHEIWYAQPDSSVVTPTGAKATGDMEVDEILRNHKRAISISGTRIRIASIG